MKILGIDPGQNGGIAVIVDGELTECVAMPQTEHDINEFFEKHKDAKVAFLEQVHSMPKQGVASTFTFGKGYGFLRGLLVANKVVFLDVTPNEWQKMLRIKAIKNEPKTAHKNRLKGRAQQLFPNQKFTLKTADAALIAWYGWQLSKYI
jgi:hypothetical protein